MAKGKSTYFTAAELEIVEAAMIARREWGAASPDADGAAENAAERELVDRILWKLA